MPEVLLVISKFLPEYTGAAYRIHNTYKRLQGQFPGLSVEVMCNGTEKTRSKSYEHEGLPVTRIVFPWRISGRPGRVVNACKVYYEAMATFFYLLLKKPDLIHVAGYSGGTMAALLYGRLKNIPRLIELVTQQATPAQYLPGLRYQKLLRLDRQTAIVAISPEIAERCETLGLAKNIWCRPNAVDENRFFVERQARNIYRGKVSPFAESDTVLCMVAKFMPQKNQLFLIEVLKMLPESYKLLLAGPRVESGVFAARDSDYFQQLLDAIARHKLSGRVFIQDSFVDAESYMKASDIYLMPQRQEGLGTPMLEAMACGLPVVANREEPAFVHWLEAEETGYLCPLEPEAWAAAIQEAANAPTEKLDEAAQCITAIAGHRNSDKIYERLIRMLVNSSPDNVFEIDKVLAAHE